VMADLQTDYIVVGGGSAGCALAGRLSENASLSVTLMEEGPRDWNPYIHIPVTYYKTAKGGLLHRYPYERSAAQTPLPGATMVQARVLGGGSSVNAMLYVRGNPEDYDDWQTQGAAGWDFRGVLPYFKRSEGNSRFKNAFHGSCGPLRVSDQHYTHPLTKVWLQAGQQAGLVYNADFNGPKKDGCGLYQITAHRGRRSSAAVAYLRHEKKRNNLRVLTGCHVQRVLIERGRAVGVEYKIRGKTGKLLADREVVLSAGAFNSPKLLMLSGIGPEEELRRNNIVPTIVLEGVGQNYQDHMELSLVYKLNGPHSYDKYKRLGWRMWAGLEYMLFRDGPVTSNVAEGGAFWRSSVSNGRPDVQLFFLAGAGIEEGVQTVPGGNGCTLSVSQTQPRSRGYVGLMGGDSHLPPRIVPNYLTDPHDLESLADGVRLAQDIMEQPAMRPYLDGGHVPPSRLRSLRELQDFVRTEAHPGLHPCGTCRIGVDSHAVVDPSLRVYGIERLRVADASVMPAMVSGNLNATAIMIGEKASDLISGASVALA
jgi:choline dehydrogenase